MSYDPITDALDALDHLEPKRVSDEEISVSAGEGRDVQVLLSGEGWDVRLLDEDGAEEERILGLAGERLVEAVAALIRLAHGEEPAGCLLCGNDDAGRLNHERSEIVCADCLNLT